MDKNIDKRKNFEEQKKQLLRAFLTLKTESEVDMFLEDICTIKEIKRKPWRK